MAVAASACNSRSCSNCTQGLWLTNNTVPIGVSELGNGAAPNEVGGIDPRCHEQVDFGDANGAHRLHDRATRTVAVPLALMDDVDVVARRSTTWYSEVTTGFLQGEQVGLQRAETEWPRGALQMLGWPPAPRWTSEIRVEAANVSRK